MSDIIMNNKMPVLALRGMTVFPEQTVHFDIGRIKSALALDNAMKNDQLLFLAPQKQINDEDPGLSGLYSIGCVARVKQILRSQGENIRVLVTGLYRARITELNQTDPFLRGAVEKVLEAESPDSLRNRAMRREANTLYANYLDFVEKPAQSIHLRMLDSDDCGFIADCIAQNSSIEYSDKAKMLCQLNPVRRL